MLGASQSISLAMIVRDCEKTVERCIRSALPLISGWTVIDTGSVDSTMEIVRETLKGLPGQLLESEWVGHAHNRTELLAAARTGCDYVLMLDADMSLVQEVCAEITVLDFGRVIARGPTAAVCADPTVIAAYLGGDA